MPILVPHRASGFMLGQPNAAVKLDVFFDIQCPHSKRFWPTVEKLLATYAENSFSVTAHLITLSNHRQAWDVSLGLFAVAEGDAQRFFDFVRYLFDRQDQFMNGAFMHKTHAELRQLIAEFAEDHAAMDKNTVLEKLDDHDIYTAARTPIRYAATRAVWATPTIFINNADDIPVRFDSPVEKWCKVIDELLI